MIPETLILLVRSLLQSILATPDSQAGADLADPLSVGEHIRGSVDADPVWSLLRPWLSERELLGLALLVLAELDARVARQIATAMAPSGPRPTFGLVVAVVQRAFPDARAEDLLLGRAVEWGLIQLSALDVPLPERPVQAPLHVALALAGRVHAPIGAVLDDAHLPRIPLPPSILAEVTRRAAGLDGPGRVLVVRSGAPAEASVVAAAVARAMDLRPCFVRTVSPGLGAWLHLARAVPVFERRQAPGEIGRLPDLPGWSGPTLCVAGLDGAVDGPNGAVASWRVPTPGPDERVQLWRDVVPPPLAEALGRTHRQGASRIAELGRLALQEARMDGRDTIGAEDVRQASWSGEGGGLSTLAQPLDTDVPDDAMVLPESLRAELHLLLDRCRLRERAAAGLGPAMTTRLRSGVRAVFIGPSGTGKTLAAGWVAGRLGIPGWRVDIASVSSKYIGETEKNLSELLARAEAAEVVLFFDEADSLFGKRTEVRHSTDRFANSQTNYLLERIERYDGIILLASNSVQRFDSAFSRRLDVFVEFPPPGAEDRRALWRAHLGASSLDTAELNLVSAHCDLAGGHIRNAALTAAVIALREGRPLRLSDLVAGLGGEYRKLGRSLPPALVEAAKSPKKKKG